MSGNTKHLAKRCVKDAGPCLALCLAGAAVATALSAGAAASKLLRASIGPSTVWNSLVLATPRARPGTRLTRETARLIRTLDFRKGPAAGA